MKPPSLYDYFNNVKSPSAKFLLKLHSLGCEIVWLLTGVYQEGKNWIEVKNLGNRIRLICKNSNTSITELLRKIYSELGLFPDLTEDGIEKEALRLTKGYVFSGEVLLKIAKYGNVSIEWLLTVNDIYENKYSEEEMEILYKLRSNPDIKELLIKLLSTK